MNLPSNAVQNTTRRNNIWKFGNPPYDLYITIGKDIFKLHRRKLASVSEYIQASAMITTASPLSTLVPSLRLAEITLDKISAVGFGIICHWIYSGHLEILPSNLSAVWTTAKKLQIRDIILQCEQFLGKIADENSTPETFITRQRRKRHGKQKNDDVSPRAGNEDIAQDMTMRAPTSVRNQTSINKGQGSLTYGVCTTPYHEHQCSCKATPTSTKISNIQERLHSIQSQGLQEPNFESIHPSSNSESNDSSEQENLDGDFKILSNFEAGSSASDKSNNLVAISARDFTIVLDRDLAVRHSKLIRQRVRAMMHAPNVEIGPANPLTLTKCFLWMRDGECQLTVWDVTSLARVSCHLGLPSLLQACLNYMRFIVQVTEEQLVKDGISREDLQILYHYSQNTNIYFDQCCAVTDSIFSKLTNWESLPRVVEMSSRLLPVQEQVPEKLLILQPCPSGPDKKAKLINWPSTNNIIDQKISGSVSDTINEANSKKSAVNQDLSMTDKSPSKISPKVFLKPVAAAMLQFLGNRGKKENLVSKNKNDGQKSAKRSNGSLSSAHEHENKAAVVASGIEKTVRYGYNINNKRAAQNLQSHPRNISNGNDNIKHSPAKSVISTIPRTKPNVIMKHS